jgi:hypothetical protein
MPCHGMCIYTHYAFYACMYAMHVCMHVVYMYVRSMQYVCVHVQNAMPSTASEPWHRRCKVCLKVNLPTVARVYAHRFSLKGSKSQPIHKQHTRSIYGCWLTCTCVWLTLPTPEPCVLQKVTMNRTFRLRGAMTRDSACSLCLCMLCVPNYKD